MGHEPIEFVGRWHHAERNLVGMTVSATEQFLGERPPGPWVFEKEAGGEYSATQPALFEGKVVAPKLGDLLEKLRRFVAAAANLRAVEREGRVGKQTTCR